MNRLFDDSIEEENPVPVPGVIPPVSFVHEYGRYRNEREARPAIKQGGCVTRLECDVEIGGKILD